MKKKLTFVAAVLLTMSMAISGCAPAKTGDTTATTPPSTEATKAPDAAATAAPEGAAAAPDANAAAMEGNMFLTGLPLVKEKEEFTIFVDDSGVAEDKILYPMLEEETNVHVNLLLFPYDVATQKLNVLLNSGDYPDVIGGWLLDDKAIMTQGMGEGVYIPVNELIDKYSPKMKEILEIPGVRNTMTLPDGKIYSVPYVIGEPLVTFLPWINQDWLTKLNLQVPTTTEELRTVLKAFKDSDPNGNGEKDEIPFSGDPNNLSIGSYAGWFGTHVSSWGQNKYFAMKDGKLQFTATDPAYKEAIKYFASLYKEGLIDPEIFTQDSATWKAKGKKGVYGVSVGYGPGDFFDADVVTNKTPYDTPLPVLKSSDSVKPVYRRNGYGVTTFRTQVAITDKAKNPAMIVRWFDNLFELDNSMQASNGPIGIKIEKTGDRQYREIDTTTMSEADRKKYDWANLFTQSLPRYCPVDVKVAPPEGKEPKFEAKPIADKLYEPFLDEPVPQFWIGEEDAKAMSTLQTDIDTFIKKKQAEWVSGQKDIDAEWEDFIAQLDKLGLPKYIEIKQKGLDSMAK